MKFSSLLCALLCFAVSPSFGQLQLPNISVSTPQIFTQGTAITPIQIQNSGGSVPQELYSYTKAFPVSNYTPGYYGGTNFKLLTTAPSGIMYFTENNQRIFSIDLQGNVKLLTGTTFGNLDGDAKTAKFKSIVGIAVSKNGDLYVTDYDFGDGDNSRIRKVTPNGVVTTIASSLGSPGPIVMDSNDVMYFIEKGKLQKMTTTGVKTQIPGSWSIDQVSSMSIDSKGNIFIADNRITGKVFKVKPDGTSTIFAGAGTPGDIFFQASIYITLDKNDNLYLSSGALIYIYSPDGKGKILSGTTGKSDMEGPGAIAGWSYPSYLTVNPNGDIYVVDYFHIKVIKTVGYDIRPALPAGLSLSNSGLISGTPTVISEAKDYVVTAANATGLAETILRIGVNIPPTPPTIADFTPKAAAKYETVTVTGTNLSGITEVKIGNTAVPFTLITSESLTIQIPVGLASGNLSLSNPHGTATAGSLSVITEPTITALSAANGYPGDKVTVTGTQFSTTLSVRIGNTEAQFTVKSDTELEATVPTYNSGSGISVINSTGFTTSPNFKAFQQPLIQAITQQGKTGSTVTIDGNNFLNTTSVRIGGKAATSFTIVNETRITAVVAPASIGTTIEVTTPAGTAIQYGFTFIPLPVITSFTPVTAGLNFRSVIITGENLANATEVYFGGVRCYQYTSYGFQIQAQVSSGASGDVVVVTPGGTATLPGFTFIPFPSISSFTPTTAAVGDEVTITGDNLSTTTAVYFGDVLASSFTTISNTTVKAVVPESGSDNLSVSTIGGKVYGIGFTHKAPVVGIFTPASANTGSTVLINGIRFTGATGVAFGGVPATAFTVLSDNQISATVGDGQSGSILVKTALGSGVKSGFSHSGPLVTSFTTNAGTDGTVMISGQNFTNATAVTFGGTPAKSFNVVSPVSIAAIVAGGTSGAVAVTTPLGTSQRTGFTFVSPPTIASFSPTSQNYGGQIVITGTNFIGVNSVKIAGLPASFFASTANSITAYIPINLPGSGNIEVNTVAGTAVKTGFIYDGLTVTDFSPKSAKAGDIVTITGTNFTDIRSVELAGIQSASFTVVSPTTITAVMADGGGYTTGLSYVSVRTSRDTRSLQGFTYIPPPIINAFSPLAAWNGNTMVINGLNLTGATAVTVGGVPVKSFTVVSSFEIRAELENQESGVVTVVTPNGTGTKSGLTWLRQPVISAFSPTTAIEGDTLSIKYSDVFVVSEIKVGGVTVPIVQYGTSTSQVLKVKLGEVKSGAVTLTAINGTAELAGFTFIPKPVITAYKWNGAPGTSTVTITGQNFNNITSVKFDDEPATAFTVVSPTVITATPLSRKSGLIAVTSTAGTGIFSGFLYDTPPSITTITPRSGPPETLITISGNNFNVDISKNLVYFGSLKATVKSASATTLTAIVPAGGSFLPISVINTDTHLTGISPIKFRITSAAFNADLSQQFAKKVDFNVDGQLGLIKTADVDGDGQNDIIVTTSNQLLVYRSKGPGLISDENYFEKVVVQDRAVNCFAAGDLTGDGKIDFCFNNSSGVLILQNTSTPGKISFTNHFVDNVNSGPFENIDIIDLDKDGKADLVNLNTTAIYRNTSDLTTNTLSFAPSTNLAIGRSSGQPPIAFSDFSGDGKPDAVNIESDYKQFVARNLSTPGTFSFLSNANLDLGYTRVENTVIEDFDADDKLDILINIPPFYIGGASILYNNSLYDNANNISFKFGAYLITQSLVKFPSIIDLNGDGTPDLLYANSKAALAYLNKPTEYGPNWITSGELASIPLDYPGAFMQINKLLAADVNGDGKPDLLVAGENQSKFSIYHNGFNITPTITSFSPANAAKGDVVTISGTNFSKTSSVLFGTQPAASFEVISPTEIKAMVGEGESGLITVTTTGGVATKDGFTFIPAPVITDFNPKFALSGATIVIKGTNLNGTTSVKFGSVNVKSFTIDDAQTITAVVNGTGSAGITVVTAGGTSFLNGLTLLPEPVIAAAGPTTFANGGSVVLSANTGSDFTYVWYKDGTEISGQTQASLTVTQSGSYQASIVAPGLKVPSNKISVVVIPLPVITSFTPQFTTVGSTVTINGAYLNGASQVKLGVTDAVSFKVEGPETITAITSTPGTGAISVTTPGGTASLAGLTVLPQPVITASGSTKFGTGGSVLLSTNTGSDFTYAWYKDGTEISGQTQASITVTQSGSYQASIVVPGLKVPSNEIPVTVIFGLPANNFKLQIGAAACKGSANGALKITAVTAGNYTAAIEGSQRSSALTFSDVLSVSDLAAGTYSVCITVAGQPDYKQCFDVVIEEPKDLQLYSSISNDNQQVKLSLSGASHYFINLNGKIYETTQQEVTLPLQTGKNEITLSSDKICQGPVTKTVQVFTKLIAFPNPFENNISVSTGDTVPVLIEIRDLNGKLVYTGKHRNESGIIQLALSDLNSGIYSLKITGQKTESYLKIIKK
ncbi:IPT/TIG domain-containing protein [Pedobacter duraquae]|nr:IPT/TIG domain-containing protein [Pedobacter duraquae]